jgi:hypothetical protein
VCTLKGADLALQRRVEHKKPIVSAEALAGATGSLAPLPVVNVAPADARG